MDFLLADEVAAEKIYGCQGRRKAIPANWSICMWDIDGMDEFSYGEIARRAMDVEYRGRAI